MKLRNLAIGALALLLVVFGGAWTLGHLMPVLIERGATRSSPLTGAAMRPTTDSLRRELELHPLAGPHDGRGEVAMIWAARSGRPEAIALLAHAGVPLSFRDQGVNGWQPLHHAVHKNQLASVRALLAGGAEVDGTNPAGLTPLMLAAAQGEGAIVETLLAAGADPRREGPSERNPLAFAVMGGDPRSVKALLARAPDLPLRVDFGLRVSRFLLRLRGRSEILRLVDDRPGER